MGWDMVVTVVLLTHVPLVVGTWVAKGCGSTVVVVPLVYVIRSRGGVVHDLVVTVVTLTGVPPVVVVRVVVSTVRTWDGVTTTIVYVYSCLG